MSKQLTAEDLWQTAHDEVWNNISPFILNTGAIPYDELFMFGGRGSGKSTSISTWIWMALTNDHKKNAVILRKVGSSIRKSCFKQMVKSLKKLRLEQFWDVNKTDLTITNRITKQQVIFLGLDDEDKVRSITTDVGYFSIMWCEEARQFNGMTEIRQARASILRGGYDEDEEGEDTGYEPQYLMFLSYNPPKSAMEWINKEAKKKVPGRLYNESSYLTMPPQWLGEGFIRTAEALKVSDPEAYEHQYLGKITGTGGRYFTKVVLRPITDDEIQSFDYANRGVDWGTKDPNIYEESYYDDEKDIIYCYKEIKQDGENEGAAPNPERYDDFAEEIKEHMQKTGCEYDVISCDAQGKAERQILEKHDLVVEFAPKHGANDRNNRYSWIRSKTLIIDPVRCPCLAEEAQLFECKELSNGEGWTDQPGTKYDHAFDALGYSYWREIETEGNASS